jgi:hypothetical protein
MKTWLARESAYVQTPRNVRDNIHFSLDPPTLGERKYGME